MHEQSEIDFSLTPFNRRDKYIVNIYFTYKVADQPIKFSTPHPIRFVEIGAASQTLAELAGEAIINMTPLGSSVSHRRRRD